jgi:ankyrin repeat protein
VSFCAKHLSIPTMASTLPHLLKAIQAGNAQEVKRVLTYNPSLAHQKQARDGYSPLHVAAGTGNLAIVRELVQAGARCQETDSNLEVPLHIACRQVSSC